MCNSSLTNDLHPDCDFPLISGVKERIIIISKENVLSISVDVANGLIVNDIILKPGKRANYILGIRNSNTSDTQMTEGEYQNSFIHNVSCLVFETDFETDEQIKNLSNANHSYYLIIEKRDEQKNGVRQFKMYGYPVGMICNSIQQTVNDNTNLGAWFLTFTNDTVANIPNVPVSIYTGDQAGTVTLVNGLLEETPIQPTTYDLINSDDEIIGSGSVNCQTNNLIPVIDTEVNIIDVNTGLKINSYSNPSGKVLNINLDINWIRPPDMLPVPEVSITDEVKILILVYENQANNFGFMMNTTTSSSYSVTATDGTNITLSSGSVFFKNFKYNDAPTNSYSTTLRCRQVMITVKPISGNINIFTTNITTSDFTSKSGVVFGYYLSLTLMNAINLSNTNQKQNNCQEIIFLRNGNITNGAFVSSFSSLSNLKKIKIATTLRFLGSINSLFSNNNLTYIDIDSFDWSTVTSMSSTFQNSSNLFFNPATVTASVTNISACWASSSIRSIKMNASSVITATSAFVNTYNLSELILIEMKASHNIDTTNLFGQEAFTNYANSLGTTTTGTITMTSSQYNSFGGSGSAIETLLLSKNWTLNIL